MKIIADSACLIKPGQARQMDVTIIPVGVILNNKSYKDYIEIQSEDLLQKLNQGIVPTTSQPSIGEVVEVLEEHKNEEILLLSIADGLSGTYQSALSAKEMAGCKNIEIVNTQTLGGAYNYLVKKSNDLKNNGYTVSQIVKELQESIEKSFSYVIPSDFNFLKRSGRLTPIAADIAGLIKIVPSLTLSEDRRKIEIFTINRTFKKSVDSIIKNLLEKGVNEEYLINICHVGVLDKAKDVVEQVKSKINNVKCEIFELSPSLMLHGGPGCILIQAIKM